MKGKGREGRKSRRATRDAVASEVRYKPGLLKLVPDRQSQALDIILTGVIQVNGVSTLTSTTIASSSFATIWPQYTQWSKNFCDVRLRGIEVIVSPNVPNNVAAGTPGLTSQSGWYALKAGLAPAVLTNALDVANFPESLGYTAPVRATASLYDASGPMICTRKDPKLRIKLSETEARWTATASGVTNSFTIMYAGITSTAAPSHVIVRGDFQFRGVNGDA